ncbi:MULTISPECIES: DUF6575 domain-containing protein [Bacillus]|uniref:DUF6575 domain-containing protein n=2 Tax=Bacillus thuringiensis TaxID=1428 RepID=A0AAP4V2S5_BACTU|nr:MULTISPECIES: DUF6575 domain-containing protein [Bacillus]MEC0046422.1 hypothetical protein [Bacillus cereus]AFV21787.1 hypothetical protein BTB_502p04820 [Bacillus thuringiensis Bt407]EEM25187.1 hypothetical protein bthur0002_58290 [Bacillus thuringiensis Bt407]ERI01037.1 hypothetical protein BTCBT_002592 [Bacillus thuringiensis T01-328]MBN6707799.1 hypothetical protein [Bacillus thuringiensis]
MILMTMEKYLNLKTIHMFDYYDFPLFLITKSKEELYYLHYFVEDVDEDTDKWLFSEISNDERLQLIERKISTLGLLKELLNTQRLYHLFVNHTEGNLQFEQINQDNLDPDGFPEEEYFVEYDYISNKKLR